MTFAPAPLLDLARYWTSQGGVNLGVVGDTRHKAKGTSYHLGRSALTADAYSRKTTRDRTGISEAASALDLGKLNGSFPELREFSVWLVARCRANVPGTQDIREVIYSPDGKSVLRWDRERGVVSDPKPGEADTSHLTHTHLSFYRDSEKRPKTAAFAPYFATVKEATVSEQDRLGAAIMTISTKYLINVLRAKDQPGILKWSTRLADYASRLAAITSPPLTKAEVADIEPPPAVEPLSSDANVAIHQLLKATGHPLKFSASGGPYYDPQPSVLADATDEQVRELALLGFFGPSGHIPGVDYSLRDRYYELSPVTGLDPGGQPIGGAWVPKDPNIDEWADYLQSKGN